MPGERLDFKKMHEEMRKKRNQDHEPQIQRALRVAAIADNLATTDEWRIFHEHLQALIEHAEENYNVAVERARFEPSFDASIMAARKAHIAVSWIRLQTLKECQQIPQTLREAADRASGEAS